MLAKQYPPHFDSPLRRHTKEGAIRGGHFDRCGTGSTFRCFRTKLANGKVVVKVR
jgi:hypothetical protein